MTLREFTLRKIAYERIQKQQILREWEQVRWLGLKVLEPYLGKNNHITVKDILPLPSDEIAENKSDFDRKIKILKERYKKNNHL